MLHGQLHSEFGSLWTHQSPHVQTVVCMLGCVSASSLVNNCTTHAYKPQARYLIASTFLTTIAPSCQGPKQGCSSVVVAVSKVQQPGLSPEVPQPSQDFQEIPMQDPHDPNCQVRGLGGLCFYTHACCWFWAASGCRVSLLQRDTNIKTVFHAMVGDCLIMNNWVAVTGTARGLIRIYNALTTSLCSIAKSMQQKTWHSVLIE